LRASRFTDDRSHAYGSRIVRGGSGALIKDKGSENGRREEEEEL
jgi:hypothetical protein